MILKNIPPILNTYENQTTQFCLVTTDECKDTTIHVNGLQYTGPGAVPVAGNITCNNVTPIVFNYHLEPEIVFQNGSIVQIELIDELFNPTRSNTAIILVIGKSGREGFSCLVRLNCFHAGLPISPKNIMVDDHTCTGVNISWSQSPNAQNYIISIKCGDTFVVQNSTVYNNSYQLSYHPSLQEQCKISVYAVNKAGNSSISSIRKNIAKGIIIMIHNHS